MRGLGGGKCWSPGLVAFSGGQAWACLKRYEPVIWLRKGQIRHIDDVEPVEEDHRIPFNVPPPYAARDIWEFAPIEEGVYLFTLADGRLFVLNDDQVSELDSREVDQLKRTHESDVVYYRVRDRISADAQPRTALRSIRADLKPEILWESQEWTLNHIGVRPGGR